MSEEENNSNIKYFVRLCIQKEGDQELNCDEWSVSLEQFNSMFSRLERMEHTGAKKRVCPWTKEVIKEQEDSEYANKERLLEFIEYMEELFGSWDDMCTCGAIENSEDSHKSGCQTLLIRSKQKYALTGEKTDL